VKKQLTMGRVVRYLLCLALICAVMVGMSYARYTTAVSGSQTASVASVSMEGTTTQTVDISDLSPGQEKTMEFQVVNFSGDHVSEVAQDYTISVKTSGNLPLTFALSGKDPTGSYAGGLSNSSGVWKTSSPGSLPAGNTASHTYALTIRWPGQASASDYSEEIDTVTLVIDAEQTIPAASDGKAVK
jgi:hypothetical protein